MVSALQPAARHANEWMERFRHLASVVVAVVREDGELVDANRGFQRLRDLRGPDASGNVAGLFMQPAFDVLASTLAEPGEPVHRGVISFGNEDIPVRSLIGAVYRDGANLIVAAEYDIAEMELLTAQVIQLNEQLASTQRELARRERHLRKLTLTDPLTGLANRRRLDAFMQAEHARMLRYPAALSVIMADIDHFKRVNDRYGHAVGDRVLQHFAGLLRTAVRAVDLAARLGGEEFILVLSMTDLRGALTCAEHLRSTILSSRLPALEEDLTSSFGVAQYQPGETAESLIQRADQALYAAKAGGRNRVEHACDSPTADRNMRTLPVATGC